MQRLCKVERKGHRGGQTGSAVREVPLPAVERPPGRRGSARPGPWPHGPSPPFAHPRVQNWEGLGERKLWKPDPKPLSNHHVVQLGVSCAGVWRRGAFSGSSHAAIFAQQSLILTKQPDFFLKKTWFQNGNNPAASSTV